MEPRAEEAGVRLLPLSTSPGTHRRSICSNCQRPNAVCLCHALPANPIPTTTRVFILHHPQEAKHKLSTTPILTKSLLHATSTTGRRLRRGTSPLFDQFPPAVYLFPSTTSSPAVNISDLNLSELKRSGENGGLVLIAFDATWKHAKEMVKASEEFLSKFAIRVCLGMEDEKVSGGSIYDSELILRKEPFGGCVSTMEAVARALRVLEPNGVEIEARLIGILREMVNLQAGFLKPVKPRPRLLKKKQLKEVEKSETSENGNYLVGMDVAHCYLEGMDVAHCYLEGNADAVEFCPHNGHHNILAASTYTLQEGDQPTRCGSISLFNVDGDTDNFDIVYREETSGIFDIKWNPPSGNTNPFLGQADADGYLRIKMLDGCCDGVQGTCLKEITSEKISNSMCLYLDWNPSSTSITVGLSDGCVSIVSLLESKLEIQEEWKAHDFELWTTSFDIHQPNLVYTGSDDCKFCCWDLRDSPSNLVFKNSKVHKMGVTCIEKSPHDPNSLLTGSYDEFLRVWDLRSISKPVTETSISLGGGVWRVKHHPVIQGLVLAACMHNGFAIIGIKGDKAEVLETYKKHDSLAYGADWQKGEVKLIEGRSKPVVATCSFYDKLVRVWRPSIIL